MTLGRPVRVRLLTATFLFVVSHAACEEGFEHDQSRLCVINFSVDAFMEPAFLGFEYWSTMGITLGVVASGLVIAAIMLAKAD